MKTITLKVDDTFDALLAGLARNLNTTKSGVMRAAVINYKNHMERVSLYAGFGKHHREFGRKPWNTRPNLTQPMVFRRIEVRFANFNPAKVLTHHNAAIMLAAL